MKLDRQHSSFIAPQDMARNCTSHEGLPGSGWAGKDHLGAVILQRVKKLLNTIDTVVIGPGLARTSSGIKAILELLEAIPCTVVADASALQEGILKYLFGRHSVMTPHLGELERMGLTREQLPGAKAARLDRLARQRHSSAPRRQT